MLILKLLLTAIEIDFGALNKIWRTCNFYSWSTYKFILAIELYLSHIASADIALGHLSQM